MDIEELFKCKDLTKSSIDSYKTKLKKLNDGKPIKNLNFLINMELIQDKIKGFKQNTQRNYIISIASILKCFLNNNKNNKKMIKVYDNYSKLLDDYNIKLKDQTAMTDTEKTNWLSKEELEKTYEEIKANHKTDKQTFQNYLLLSLYYLQAPRRNKDYQLLKITSKYNDGLSNEFNYLDMKKKKFIFNNYKTAKKYNKQEVEINEELIPILNSYIKVMKLKDGDFILNDLKTNNQPFKNTNAITILLNRIFKKKIGASMLRKLYLTNKYGDQVERLKEDMKAMGSSVEVASNNYIKKK